MKKKKAIKKTAERIIKPVMTGDYILCGGGYIKHLYEVMSIQDSENGKPILKMQEVSPDEIDRRRTLHWMGGADGVHPRFKQIIEVDENGDLVTDSVWNRE